MALEVALVAASAAGKPRVQAVLGALRQWCNEFIRPLPPGRRLCRIASVHVRMAQSQGCAYRPAPVFAVSQVGTLKKPHDLFEVPDKPRALSQQFEAPGIELAAAVSGQELLVGPLPIMLLTSFACRRDHAFCAIIF
jgi:hypothetical protein